MMKRLFVFAMTLILLCTMILPIVALEPPPLIPDEIDYGGWEAKLLLWNNAKYELFPEKQSDGQTLRNDLYERNEMIERELGITFIPTFKESHMSGTGGDALYNEALEGIIPYEAIAVTRSTRLV